MKIKALFPVLLVFASARFAWPADCTQDAHGLLTAVSDGSLSVSVTDDLVVETTNAVYRISQLTAEKAGAWRYRYRGADASFELAYSSVSGAPFVKRTLTMRFAVPTVLVRVSRDLPTGGAAFLYHTFWNASAAVFLRQDGIGVACGFENPYCALSGGRVSFEPSLELAAGEAFTCDADFTGVYALSGERVRPELNASILLRNGRYHPRYRNPDEGIALDRAEIAAMNGYMRDYCAVDAKPFYLTSYQFFSNLAQRPSSAEQRDAYLRNLDGIAALGGDAVILNPLCTNSVPNAEPSSCWGLFPPNSYAAEIRAHAAALGLKTGIYMGTAGTGVHGNSTIIPYANVTAWKKVDLAGASSGENCLACDAFMDWYVAVQTNTIARYALDIWNWDPGPGNGFFCHASGHGHLPGKGAYKGFRNALRVMKALRDFKPGLYYQGFHGLKEYGSWGFKYMDQHEAFWENDNYDKTPVFADLAADRQTADGIRFQSRWNHDFRFLPPAINHGLAHRMAQACYRPAQDVDLLIDGCGWQYALLSAIAAGGAVTLPIVPRDVSVIPGYKAFYAKWIGWARSHFDWQTAPIGATPYCGGPDGFVKFKDGKCYVFMFNPYPYPLGATVKLDDRVGLSGSGDVSVMRLYPAAASLGRTAKGGDYVLTVPDYGCVVLGFGTSDAVVPAAVTPALPRTLPLTDGAGCRRATFAGSADLRKALATYAPVMTDAAKAAAQDYVSKYNRVNGVWTRPDRLWLWIVPDVLNQESSFSVTLNGRSVTLSRDNLFGVKTLWFADITDLADLDGANELVLAGNAANLTAYLHYPRPETEAIPSAVRTAPSGRFVAPVLDDTLKIQSVELNDGLNVMRPNRENVLRVKLNAADDRIAGVYASTPISLGTPGDALRANMVLDRKGNGVWERRFTTLGRLQLIVDDDKITCWAVTTGRTESASYTLPFEWLLTNSEYVPGGREGSPADLKLRLAHEHRFLLDGVLPLDRDEFWPGAQYVAHVTALPAAVKFVTTDGEEKLRCDLRPEDAGISAPPFDVAVLVTGCAKPSVFVRKDGKVRLLGLLTLPDGFDPREVKYAKTLRFRAEGGAEVSEVALTAGIGQADVRFVTEGRENRPYAENGRLFFTFSSRGYGATLGVMSIDPAKPSDLRFEGTIFFDYGDGRLRNDIAADLFHDFESGEWRAYVCNFSTGGESGTKGRAPGGVNVAWSKESPLHGVSVMRSRPLGLPAMNEDPDGIWDAKVGKWRLLLSEFCSNGVIRASLWESKTWDGPFARLTEPVSADSTGTTIVPFGGRRYCLAGSADRKCYVYSYPTMEYLGALRFDVPPWPVNAKGWAHGRVWPSLVELPGGRVLMVTMDRTNFPGMPEPNWTYGKLKVYEAHRP